MLDKELLNYINGKRHLIVLCVIYNLLGFITNVLITASLVFIVYNLIENELNLAIYSSLFLILFIILRIIFTVLANVTSRKLADYVQLKLRNDTYHKFLALNLEIPFTINEMAQLSTEGIEQLRLYYQTYLPSFFYTLIAPLLLFILFMFLDKVVAIIYLVAIPLIPVSIVLVSKFAKRIFNKYWNIYLNLGDSFLDSVKGLKELKIFTYDEDKEEELNLKSEEFRKITMKVLVMQLYSVSIMDLVAYGGAALGIAFSLISLQNGLNYGVVLFMVLIGAEFFLPLRRLGSAFHVAMNGATAFKKVIKLLNEEEQIRNLTVDARINSITITNLNFSYDNKVILKDINLSFEKGLYSLVGISGSGKSTIAKLLANINKNYIGNILINNKLENKDIKLSSFYKRVCYISNNTFIFHNTIKEAFLFYNDSLKEEDMWELLELVNMKEIIKRNGGLDFKLNEDATNISGGEKQRLVLAYYLSKDYDFYIFDEATSNIDIESEEIILNIINKLALKSIVINITHRLKNVVSSNYIYYLDDGRIIEQGNFCDLIAANNKFKAIYDLQCEMEATA